MINRYLIPLFGASILVSLLHFVALLQEYYWTLWWYDVMMHLLGGAVISALYIWLATSFVRLPKAGLWQVVSFVLFVGIAWEVWEILAGFTGFEELNYKSDTIYDLINDTIGAIAMFFIIRKK
jgi:hypothetical protein